MSGWATWFKLHEVKKTSSMTSWPIKALLMTTKPNVHQCIAGSCKSFYTAKHTFKFWNGYFCGCQAFREARFQSCFSNDQIWQVFELNRQLCTGLRPKSLQQLCAYLDANGIWGSVGGELLRSGIVINYGCADVYTQSTLQNVCLIVAVRR